MPAVSDSSPLILFSAIGRLDLLHAVYDVIVVPPAVWDEVVIAGSGRVGAAEIPTRLWIRQLPLPESATGFGSRWELHRGETEAIGLALVLPQAPTVILDDLRARRQARALGLDVTGSVGVLLAAKRTGVLPTVRPDLDRLREAGLRLSDETAARALALADE